MRRVRATVALVLAASIGSGAGPARPVLADPVDAYVWPLEVERCVTSVFGDYRDGHFHAGIDLSTGGREGLAVRSAGGGWVSRVRASCKGYGKTVYVRLADGRTAVYAHLSRFSPAVGREVRLAQRRAGSYEVDVPIEPGTLPVRAGDVVGYTGQTGAGPPHLHFEIRDEDERPLNPLSNGVSVPDTIPPAVERILLRPLDWASSVDGGREDVVVRLRWSDEEACYVHPEPILCSGRVGLFLEGSDRMNLCRRNLTLSGAVLSVDGATLFETRFTGFSYDETQRIDTYYDRGRVFTRGEEFHRLYRAKGNSLGFGGSFGEGAGVIAYRPGSAGHSLGHGRHRVEVRALDAAGNEASARLDVILDARPVVAGVDAHRTDGGVVVWATVADPDDSVGAVRVVAEGWPDGSAVKRAAVRMPDGRYRAVLDGWGSDGRLSVAIRAQDRWGYESAPRFLIVEDTVPGAAGEPTAPGSLDLDLQVALGPTGDCLEVSITAPGPLAGLPEVGLPDVRGRPVSPIVEQAGPRAYRAVVPLGRDVTGRVRVEADGVDLAGRRVRGGETFEIWNVSPEAGGAVRDEVGGFTVEIASGMAYHDLWLTARSGHPWSGAGEIQPCGPTYRVEPEDAVFDGEVWVELGWAAEGMPAERVGICTRTGDSEWTWIGGERDPRTGRIGARARYLTEFSLAADLTPPRVAVLRPKAGASVPSDGLLLRASARDEGSGLECGSVSVTLDGGALIAEFDPELGLVVCSPWDAPDPGEHRLEVWAVDRAGNRAGAQSTFWVD